MVLDTVSLLFISTRKPVASGRKPLTGMGLFKTKPRIIEFCPFPSNVGLISSVVSKLTLKMGTLPSVTLIHTKIISFCKKVQNQ